MGESKVVRKWEGDGCLVGREKMERKCWSPNVFLLELWLSN